MAVLDRRDVQEDGSVDVGVGARYAAAPLNSVAASGTDAGWTEAGVLEGEYLQEASRLAL